MYNIQNVFNKVIENNLYPYNPEYLLSRDYMCYSIIVASDVKLITNEEAFSALQAIDFYLNDHGTLVGMLKEYGISHTIEDRLKIYKDWKNRPTIPYISYGR